MAHPPRLHTCALLGLAGCLSLAGCGQSPTIPGMLYLSLTINADQSIDATLIHEFRVRLAKLESSFQQLHPDVRFQFSVYPKDSVEQAIQRRNWTGLGPDLLFVDGETAQRLLRAGLVDPFPASPAVLKLFEPDALMRVSNSKGQLAGLPVMSKSQVACYNRKRLPKPPATLRELLELSAKKHPIGLPADLNSLFWTSGSLGALPGLNRAVAGEPLSAADRRAIERWLAWLQNAGSQVQITFFANQQSAIAEFEANRLDWLPCQSTTLPVLRQKLGAALGVTNLPSGDGGPPSPLNHLRVMALGRNSSAAGRARALAFAHFSTNPMSQRSMTLGSEHVLPANHFVKVPTQSSEVLRAMVQAQQDGRQTEKLVRMINDNDPRIAAAENLITSLVFGETNPKNAAQRLITIVQGQR